MKERYTRIKSEYTKVEEEVRQDKARLSVKKEELQRKREEMKVLGIEFKSLKDLRELKEETENRIESQVSKMEEVLGVGAGDDGEEFELSL